MKVNWIQSLRLHVSQISGLNAQHGEQKIRQMDFKVDNVKAWKSEICKYKIWKIYLKISLILMI